MGALKRSGREFDHEEKPLIYKPSANCKTICDVLEVDPMVQGERIERAIARHGMGKLEAWMRSVTLRERNAEIHHSQLWDLFAEEFPDDRLL